MDNIENTLENLEDLGHGSISFYDLEKKPLDLLKGFGVTVGESYFIKHDFKMIVGNIYYAKGCKFEVLSECESEFGNYIVKIINKDIYDISFDDNNTNTNNEEYVDNWFCDNTIHRFIHENFNDIVPLGQLHPENRPEIESLVGTEFYNWKPYRKSGNKIIMRRIGSKFRIGKYIVVEIDNDMANYTAGKVRIIREITTFEKVILIIKKHYKDILSDIFLPPSKNLRKWSKNSFLSQWYTKATYGVMLMMKVRIESDNY